MQRYEVNQRLLDLYDQPSYLEIGVFDGATFHAVKAARKVAVDPAFRFDPVAAAADPANEGATYHPVPSDEYFASAGADESFDVIFVDGLHTFDQTLRDLLNAMQRLKPGGAIIVDDVRPSSYGASLPDLRESGMVRIGDGITDPSWMGDVYRLVFFIRDYLPAYSYATVTENHGQTVLWREARRHAVPPRDVAAIAAFGYKEIHLQRDAYNMRPFAEIEALVRAARARA